MRKLLKISLVCVTGAFVFSASPKLAMACEYEVGVAGFVYDKDTSIASNQSTDEIVSLSTSAIPVPGYTNIGIAIVDTNLLIRSGPGENQKIIGKLPKDGGCDILEERKDGWSKISADTDSGSLKGYVKTEYLVTGSRANEMAKEVGSYVATSNSNGLNVRGKASTDAKIVDTIAKGEELIVLDSKVETTDKEHNEWVKVSLDSDTKKGSYAYVAKEYVNISYQLVHAVSTQESKYGTGVSSARVSLVSMARAHLGEAYVWGGTRLGRGVDCSGFTQALYRQMGISIPRTSRSQANSGTRISASELRPGDLVFYGSSGYISHVAMYVGNGLVVHASNHRDGIKTSNMYYRSPIKFVRYIR